MKKIIWSKTYQEDKGAETEDGSYGYDYRYFTYWFALPDKQKIRARRYTDTPDQCAIYVSLDDLQRKNNSEPLKTKDAVFGIINFLTKIEGVKKVEYFSGGYKPVDLTKMKNNLKDFTFVEDKTLQ